MTEISPAGKGSFHLAAYSPLSSEVSQGRSSGRAGTYRQELMPRPWRDAVYWLASHGLLSLLSFRTQDHQYRGVPIYNGLTLPH